LQWLPHDGQFLGGFDEELEDVGRVQEVVEGEALAVVYDGLG
jgi:hypothetical protein